MPNVKFNMDLLSIYTKMDIEYETISDIIMKSKFGIEGKDNREIEVEITQDRLDLSSMEGFSVFIQQMMGKMNNIEFSIKNGDKHIAVENDKVGGRPFIALSIVKNVELKNEEIKYLMNYQEILTTSLGNNRKIASIGLYPVNDASFPLIYTSLPLDDIKFQPLGEDTVMSACDIIKKHPMGIRYGNLIKEDHGPVILDNNKNILSMPPIVNSIDFGKIDEMTNTMLVEVTGTDKKRVNDTLILMLLPFIIHGFKIESVIIKGNEPPYSTPVIKKRIIAIEKNDIDRIWGLKFETNDIIQLLERSGYCIIEHNNRFIKVEVPVYRIDVLSAIDIIEDIGIMYGYNKIEPSFPVHLYTEGGLDFHDVFYSKFEDYLVGFGFLQTHTMILNSVDRMDSLGINCIKLKNPTSNLYNGIRPNLFFSLLNFSSFSTGLKYPQRIFERGLVVRVDDYIQQSTGVNRNESIGFMILKNDTTFTDGKIIHDFILEQEKIDAEFIPSTKSYLLDGRSADIIYKKTEIGFIGEVSPQSLKLFNIKMPAVAGELYLDKIAMEKIKKDGLF
ncbi:MAG: phenylalanine--tRNA ligase subunit beta [Candidatus Thermoplasmatota archaeon]|nr:phenylalanine--tRNA ligase subunit beta [Candidatus Thermoplasmatota archaeon]MCL5963566.1 phenylalanine--tRNA ligase subunit beta [Candidatus Thermoplasmatota archaeon]